MPLDYPSGNTQWDAASGRGLPAIPPPERKEVSEAQEPQQTEPTGPTSVAQWLGWSPSSWRARDPR